MTSRTKSIPLTSDNLGVRSICSCVKTADLRTLIDPGGSLGYRFRLLPHLQEYEAIVECRNRIVEYAKKAEVVTISPHPFDYTASKS